MLKPKTIHRYILGTLRPLTENPVFILGNQKSGTTAIAALLAHRTGLSVTLDIPPFWTEAELAVQRGSMTLDSFVRRHRYYFTHDIIKEPALTFCFGQLMARYPDARYVLIVRNPYDNVRSILNRLGLPGDLVDINDEQLQTLPPVWQAIVSGTILDSCGENYIDHLAQRWTRAAKLWLEDQHDFIRVRYEDFQQDKLALIDSLALALQLEMRNDIRDRLDIQYQPKGEHSVDEARFFGHKNLARITAICGDYLEPLGYQPVLKPEQSGPTP